MPKGNPGVAKTLEHNAKNALAYLGKKRPDIALSMKGNTRTLGKRWNAVHSEAWCLNQSQKMLGNRNWQSGHNPTKIELRLQDILSIFEDVKPYCQFGRFQVDVYIPAIHTAFEADGAYWHQDKAKDDARDRYLEENFGLRVIHVTEQELLAWTI